MSEDRIRELRSEIDTINLQMLELLNRRATIVAQIDKVHAEMSVPFYDPQREAKMLTALEMANKGPFSNETIKGVFREIFRASLASSEEKARAKILVHRKSPDQQTV